MQDLVMQGQPASVGTKEWFLEPFLTSQNSAFFDDSITERSSVLWKDSHVGYNSVKESASIGFIYIRKLYDSLVEKDLASMERFFITGIYDYLDRMELEISDNDITESEIKTKFIETPIFTGSLVDLESIVAKQLNDSESRELIFNCWIDNTRNKEETINAIFSENSDLFIGLARATAGVQFFSSPLKNISIDEFLTRSVQGFIYQPPDGDHSWFANLGWLLCHIHKGHNFQVVSDISNEHLFRKSQDHTDELSGFSREIAVLQKFGYKPNITQSGVIFFHSNPECLSNLKLQDVLITKDDEVKSLYRAAVLSVLEVSFPEEEKTLEIPEGIDQYGSFFPSDAHQTQVNLANLQERQQNIEATVNTQDLHHVDLRKP